MRISTYTWRYMASANYTYTIAGQVDGNTSVRNSSLSVDGRDGSSDESDNRELHV